MITPRPMRVAVIGGGPGGMFFCHSVHKLQQQQQQDSIPQERNTFDEKKDDDYVIAESHPSVSVEVTCFERDMAPGGIWKTAEAVALAKTDADSDDDVLEGENNNNNNLSTRMYDELWTNGPSHSLEFHDYTWEEHFGSTDPIPMYIPRKDVAEYLIGRVLKDNPTFFQDHFQFGTQVVKVVPLDEFGFQVTTQSIKTGATTDHFFDKVIWAAGENGKAMIPRDVQDLFAKATQNSVATTISQPKLLHSTQTHELKAIIQQANDRNAHVLLVGGSFSGEDLALQCIKWGAGQVDVSTRGNEGPVSWMSDWPADKVKVHLNSRIKDVEQNGTGSLNVSCDKVAWTWPHGYKLCEDEEDEEIIIENVNVVVFCTGYKPNFSMLDERLRPGCGSLPMYWMGLHDTMFLSREGEEPTWLPKDWKMDDTHRVHALTGDVPATPGSYIRSNYNHPEIHRCIFLNNPDMMFLSECGFETPLLALDVNSWLLASYLTGTIPTPTVEELQQKSLQQVIAQMDVPLYRYAMDGNYAEVLNEFSAGEGEFWPARDGSTENCTWYDCEHDALQFQFRELAQLMEDAKYPGVSLGNMSQLSEAGKAQVDFTMESGYSREYMEEVLKSDPSKKAWYTFRDDEKYHKGIYSLYTKTRARPLKKKWLEAIGADCSVRNGDI